VVDLLIVGQGLAGSVLAFRALQRGWTVHVVDNNYASSASMVAAGMFNPMSFRSVVETWEASQNHTMMLDLFRSMEKEFGVKLMHDLPLVRVFPDSNYRTKWESKAESLKWIEHAKDDDSVRAPFGTGTVNGCGYVDLPLLLKTVRDALIEKRSFSQQECFAADVVEENGVFSWSNVLAKRIVFCTGAVFNHPLIPIVPNKGEVLTVDTDLPNDRILNNGKWLMPHHSGVFRLGATYERLPFTDGPTAEVRDSLLHKIGEMVTADINVLKHEAGIRPTTPDRKPVCGKIADGMYVLNGLGTRGVLIVARTVSAFIDYLADDTPLPPEIDVNRYSEK
jgi:glycine oxidase